MPKVSVVIPTYNYGQYIVGAVESVLNQTFRDMEVIVVDDGSADNTRELMAEFGDKIRYIYQPNRGLPAARNTGIRAGRGEYVAILDSDDLWLPQKLSVQVPLLDSRPEVGLVYTDAFVFDGETQVTIGTHRDACPHPAGRIVAQLLFMCVMLTPTPLIRRSVLDKVGLFAEDKAIKGCEDWDLWIRIAKVYDIDYIDQPLAKYRLHSSNMSRDPELMKLSSLNVLWKAFADPALAKELKRLRRRAFSRIYKEYGLGHLDREEYNLARADLIQAIKLNPRLLLNWHVGTRSLSLLLGSKFTAKIRSYRREALSLVRSLKA